MTRNVSYKECTCDICGKVETISMSATLPKQWESFKIGNKSYDVCLDCFIKVDMAMEDLKQDNNRKKVGTGGCIYNNSECDWDFCK